MSEAPRRLIHSWLDYCDAHPEFYKEFSELAGMIVKHGHKRTSAWLIVNQMRWRRHLATGSLTDFVVSNDYIALFARKYMHDHPEHAGLFELKPMRNVTELELKGCL